MWSKWRRFRKEARQPISIPFSQVREILVRVQITKDGESESRSVFSAVVVAGPDKAGAVEHRLSGWWEEADSEAFVDWLRETIGLIPTTPRFRPTD